MSWRLTAHAEIADRAHQPFSKVMLPHSIYDHTCYQRAGTVLDVREPGRQRLALIGRIGALLVAARVVPVVDGCTVMRKDIEKPEFDRVRTVIEITSTKEPRHTRRAAEVTKHQRIGTVR